MAPQGLVCPRWCPWSLVASEAAHRPGRWAFPSRTTGLCRELGLQETEEAPLCPLVLVTWHLLPKMCPARAGSTHTLVSSPFL